MRWNYRTILVIVIAVLLSSTFVHAQKQSWNLNFKGGIMLPGTITVDGYDGDTELGWIVNTAFDGMVAEKLSMGGYFFYSGISEAETGESLSANIMSIGGTIKGRFQLRSGTQLRPGLILAYQITTGDAFDDVKGLNVGFTFEAAFPLKDFKAIVAELGFTTQPSGGNADADVTWAPIFYLTVGYEFGG
ncbi:MAG: hypothetical protein KAV45_06985 [Calditrichia bacterium]|jgi:hypothetical protein|nr:hypothetical protein [Calditrichia bacterium]